MKNINQIFEEEKLLVKLLSKAHIKHHEVFSQADFGANKSMMGKMFDLINERDFRSIEELQLELYGNITKSKTNFLKLHHGFKEKLANTMYFIDTNVPLFVERAKAYYTCAKRVTTARILSERGATKFSLEVVESTLPIALKYEFTEISILLLRFLKRRFSNEANLAKFNKALKIYESLIDIYIKEMRMEYYSHFVALRINISNKNKKAKLKKNEKDEIYEEACTILKSNPSVDLLTSCSVIVMSTLLDKGDFENYKKWSGLVLSLILNKPFLSAGLLEVLISNTFKIALITKDAKIAINLDNQYGDKLTKGSINWYFCYYYLILTLMHSRKYAKANDIINLINKTTVINSQAAVIREQFILIQAYLYFIENLNNKTPSKSGEFRISKFLNQVPEYSKDKEGSNISILLVQILYFLKEDKYNKIIDRMESLKLYSYRHLRKDENFRSQCFFRMLNEMVKADFRKKGTEFRTQKLYQKLISVPIETFPNAAEREIIPYEDLWELILGHLK